MPQKNWPSKIRPPKIWINTGEISGDLHGASLAKALWELEPNLRLLGMGGPAMRAAGVENLFQVEELSVMGLTEVLAKLPKILRLLKSVEKRLELEKPDALAVIDAPAFNFRLVRAACRLGIPVYYYISPKVWARNEKRVFFLKENVRRLISILPFEVEFFAKYDLPVDYVGNPLLDALNLPELDKLSPIPGRVGLLPGSRRREVSSLMPEFATAARLLLEQKPELEFCCAVAPGLDEAYLRSFWDKSLPIAFFRPEERYQAMRRCEMLFAASGTAVLESALIGTPTLIAYKLSRLTFALGKLLVKSPFIGLPNLIAGREIFPELLQAQADGTNLARLALHWLEPERDGGAPGASYLTLKPKGGREGRLLAIGEVRRELAELRQSLGGPGATGRAAGIILDDLQKFQSVARGKLSSDFPKK
ncbi:MAG: lipid-A-disaccharide synthase [Deltaproteobacteria bacterium]|jgi:lipid-A-disaccharide synthase|nr:lipid-A-disaccharide synthase [Deltaproteobacteria bacterium]